MAKKEKQQQSPDLVQPEAPAAPEVEHRPPEPASILVSVEDGEGAHLLKVPVPHLYHMLHRTGAQQECEAAEAIEDLTDLESWLVRLTQDRIIVTKLLAYDIMREEFSFTRSRIRTYLVYHPQLEISEIVPVAIVEARHLQEACDIVRMTNLTVPILTRYGTHCPVALAELRAFQLALNRQGRGQEPIECTVCDLQKNGYSDGVCVDCASDALLYHYDDLVLIPWRHYQRRRYMVTEEEISGVRKSENAQPRTSPRREC